MSKSGRRDKAILVILILVAIALLFFFLLRAHSHYSVWKSYHDYFDNPNPKIESWMTVRMISARFNITSSDIFKEAGVNGLKINPHISLDSFCKQYHQNCTELVERLNRIAGK